MNFLNPCVARHYFRIGNYSISWVFLGKCYSDDFKVICSMPFGTDLYLIKFS